MMTVQSNVSGVVIQIAAKLENLQRGGVGYNALLFNVTSGLLYDIKSRIHQQGLAADSAKIGEYSKKPMYLSIKKGIGPPVGKTGYSKFKSGKRKGQLHTSRYFTGGYHQYKTAIGRSSTGSVNLNLTGQLNQHLTLLRTQSGYGFGWADNSLLQRAIFLEKKYNKKIWSLTEAERSKAFSIAKQFIANAIS